MTINEMFGQSGILAILGMGIVFSFLIIMIITITVMGKVVHALGWDKDLQEKPAPVVTASTNNTAQAAAVTAAITAAVSEYRKTHS
ncbi:MAG: OadG family protein [Spirochaetaceae bacterium]|jgi:oxaloacetate decarboxylase gamma subunit|nr:OadG family protein [Spirochaetaceae bacterium]